MRIHVLFVSVVN
ncbi:hypothetical protein KSF78_0008455 [Schistosoma japonicum]|nr:hypothetical protein KSF78_0008455 [Schistosoma japonicum]